MCTYYVLKITRQNDIVYSDDLSLNSNVLGNACSVLGVTFLRSIDYGSRTCQTTTSQAINSAAHTKNNNHYFIGFDHDYKEENEFYPKLYISKLSHHEYS